MKNVLYGFLVLATVNSFGADQKAPTANPTFQPTTPAASTTTATSVSTETVATAAPANAITGTVDLRPSYGSRTGELHSENYVDLGYKFADRFHVIYEQDFNTGGYNTPAWVTGGDSNFQLWYGAVRFKANNLWESADKTYSLSYELRPYLPTYAPEREKGMITWVRNYAKFAAKVSDTVTLSLWEVVIPRIYSRDGNGTAATPSFENRVYLMADWNITDKLSLNANLILNSTKYRDFAADTTNGGKWNHYLWTYPELDYAITPNYTVGVSYYSDNFIAPDFSDLTLGSGFENGVTQLVFRATL